MTPCERVQAALAFQAPDRIPRYDVFWSELADACRPVAGVSDDTSLEEYFGNDLRVAVADETPFLGSRVIEERGDETVYRDGWGALMRSRRGSYFNEVLDVEIRGPKDLDKPFVSPIDPRRYTRFLRNVTAGKARHEAVFCKIGGPYMRSNFMRGTEQFLTDIAADPDFAIALATRVAEHLLQVALESLRRGDLFDTGVWIFDDIASNQGPMCSPKDFARIFLPLYDRLVSEIKRAGARYCILHSDGNILPVLDMLLDVGIDGINPVEPRAGMHVTELRRKYGSRLALIGGMCNSLVLPNGPVAAIEAQAREIIAAGREGGVVIGTHSVGPDIPVPHYLAFDRVVRTEGLYEGV